MPSKDACPCSSGRPYRACCEPLHRGQRDAADAEMLMRSRYAAFARKQVDYLWRTLHPDHPERLRPEAEVKRALAATASTFKYPGLEILEARAADERGPAQVLFLARVFERGRECSFVELSDFAHDGEGWRYLAGKSVAVSQLTNPSSLTIDEFLRR
jgi:SEC-C motif-containing protein